MKPIVMTISGLKCDAPGCTYTQAEPTGNSYEDYAKWLNAQCPLCGANLLTLADLRTTQVMMRFVRIINLALWPLGLFSKKTVKYRLGMDGSGAVKPERID